MTRKKSVELPYRSHEVIASYDSSRWHSVCGWFVGDHTWVPLDSKENDQNVSDVERVGSLSTIDRNRRSSRILWFQSPWLDHVNDFDWRLAICSFQLCCRCFQQGISWGITPQTWCRNIRLLRGFPFPYRSLFFTPSRQDFVVHEIIQSQLFLSAVTDSSLNQ
jgi:hypothetical protein